MDPVAGDRITALFEGHGREAVRLAYLMTGDQTLAEDIAQEAFLRVIGRLGHLRRGDAFEGYLRKTVVNLCRAHFRRRKVETQHARRREPVAVAPDPHGSAGVADIVRNALLRLPLRQRTAVVLRYWLDLSDEQSAELMGCARGTVRALVAQAMQKLRAEMRGE